MKTKLEIYGYKYIALHECKIVRKINQHAYLYIRGLFEEEICDRCIRNKDNMKSIALTWHDNGQSELIFKGVVTSLMKTTVNNACELEIIAYSHSILLDQDECFRTFQDEGLTYGAILKSIQEQSGFGFIAPGYAGKSTSSFYVQYRETNWEFFRRLASCAHTCIVADSLLDYPYISFGMPSNRKVDLPATTDFSVHKDMEQYYYWTMKLHEKITERECIYYSATSRLFIDLCAETVFDGNRLYVYSSQTEYIKGELLHTYDLRPQRAFESRPEVNPHIQGLSLRATVHDTDKDFVQVEFDNDESTLNNTKRWFKFASVYTSPTGAGWYFMPENLERLRIIFPSEYESHAYAMSIDNRKFVAEDVQSQILQTKHGQTLTFTPRDITLENRDGSKIVMEDDKGIRFISNRDILIKADNSIHIDAGRDVNLLGGDSIHLDKGNSSITIHEQILLKGDRIKMKKL